MKNFTKIISILILLLIGLVSCYSQDANIEAINNDERLFIKDNILFLERDNKENEINKFDGKVNDISWSDNGKYFLVNEENKTYIYSRDNLKNIYDFNSNGNSIFSSDSEKVLFGENEILNIYYLDGKVVEVLKGNSGEIIVPKSFVDDNISFGRMIGDNIEIESIELKKSGEESLMDLVENKEDTSLIVDGLIKINFDKFRELYGSEGIEKVLDYLKLEKIKSDDIEKFLNLMDKFTAEEYYRFVEVLGEVYLDDIVGFTKAIYSFDEKDKVVHSLHDIKLYDRENVNVVDGLNEIINSDRLNEEEKSLGISIISSYVDCGT